MYRYKILFAILNMMMLASFLNAQINLKRDDFTGTVLRNWWNTRNDGTGTQLPIYKNGYISFLITNPDENVSPWYDCEIYDGYPDTGGPWNDVEITVRIKMMNSHKDGSHGWGLWYTEWPVNVQNQAFFMRDRDKDQPSQPDFMDMNWFRADVVNGMCEEMHRYTELNDGTYPDVDETLWHTYKIIRNIDDNGVRYVEMLVDGTQVFYDDNPISVPSHPMAFHIWVDNMIYDPDDGSPDCNFNYYLRSWLGSSEMVLDYVQIIPANNQIGQSEVPSGVKLLREIPNEIYSGENASLWKSYSVYSPGGNTVILMTGRVEQYLDDNSIEISGDDDIHIIIDGTDYGWNSTNSFNGDAAGTISKTLAIEQTMTQGKKTIEIYGETSPLLYDVTVLGNSGGGIVYTQVFNETKASNSDELWKEITFQTWGGEVAFYISGTADEDPAPTRYGYQYSDFNDDNDDDLKIQIDNTDYGYQNDNALWGNRLFGEPKSILIVQNLTQGEHTLRIYGQNTPTIYSVIIYGGNDDTSLPVTYTTFSVETKDNMNKIKWQTESELNNLGFNLYKAFNSNNNFNILSFSKLNNDIIQGKGSVSYSSEYTYNDKDIGLKGYYWYCIEDISITGEVSVYDTIMVDRTNYFDSNETFELLQNYPNPFNSNTKISFYLKEKSNIQLEIRSISGEKVCVLENCVLSVGKHVYTWNGKNNLGKNVTSGIYLYYLKSNSDFQKARKLLLLK